MTGPLPRRAARFTVLAVLASGALAAGCGQKGPLYLPGATPERVEPGIPAGASPASQVDAERDGETDEQSEEETSEQP
jgi:predicted small lipoprotein YifL